AFYCEKIRVFQAGFSPNTLAWNNGIGLRLTNAKAFAKDVFINQERKLGDQRRSDTVVVLTINYTDSGSAGIYVQSAPYEKSKSLGSGGSMVRKSET
ncbi:hypothetical protein DAPPUDRAFT_68692, partial [Daphnia pulex]